MTYTTIQSPVYIRNIKQQCFNCGYANYTTSGNVGCNVVKCCYDKEAVKAKQDSLFQEAG